MDIIVLIVLLLLLACATYLERRKHSNYLLSIPIRIHVNGTRGKSSVARLIAAGLRKGGLGTLCKTTGSEAKLVMSDNDEITIKRGCIPNIIEQCKVEEFAASKQADVLIVECMALKPELQAYSELTLVKSTHGVITNSGPDHLDIMGPTELDVAKALAGTVPVTGRLYTNEKTHINVFKEAAFQRGTQLINIIPQNRISDNDMANFSYIEHKDNVALALTVCRDLGVDHETALQGMWQSTPDLGAMDIKHLSWHGKQISLVNAFAANDPLSSRQCWFQALEQMKDNTVFYKVLLVNCREDRQERSIQLGAMCTTLDDLDKIVITGTGRQAFVKSAISHGMESKHMIQPVDQKIQAIVELLTQLNSTSLFVVGIGNIKNTATDLWLFFSHQASLSSEATNAMEVSFG